MGVEVLTDGVIAEEHEINPPLETTTDLGRDLRLIRATMELPSGPSVNASSVEAAYAMARIFERINFEGMSRENVLWVLGDPATISDYGIAAEEGEDSLLIYRVSSGLGGLDYRLEFENGHVVRVRIESLN